MWCNNSCNDGEDTYGLRFVIVLCCAATSFLAQCDRARLVSVSFIIRLDHNKCGTLQREVQLDTAYYNSMTLEQKQLSIAVAVTKANKFNIKCFINK